MELVSTGFVRLYLLLFYSYCINTLYSVLKCFVHCITPQCSCLVGGYCFFTSWLYFKCLLWLDIPFAICGSHFMNCILLGRGFSLVFKRNSAEFLVDSRELGYFRNLLPNSLNGRIPVFQTGCDILMPYGFLTGFWEIEAHSRTCSGCHMSTLWVKAWQKLLMSSTWPAMVLTFALCNVNFWEKLFISKDCICHCVIK